MAEYEMPPLNGENKKDYGMPHTQNGRLPRGIIPSAPPVQINVTGPRLFLLFWTAVLALLQGQWIILPAKDSDLKHVQEQIAGLREDMQGVSLDMRGMRADSQRLREELIRMGASSDVSATQAIAAPPARRFKPKARVVKEIK